MTEQDRVSPEGSPDRRPRPQFGELAPEGWTWTPEGGSDASAQTDAAVPPTEPTEPTEPATPTAPAARPTVGPIPGVPHNLGAGGSTPAPPTAAAGRASGDPEPYRATPPNSMPPNAAATNAVASDAPVAPPAAPRAARSGGDRIATIVLVAIGALGALYFAASIYQLPNSLAMAGSMLGRDDVVVPASVTTLANVGAIVVLALYAVTLIYSLQRLRSGKLTFWVPLAAGAVALILTFAFTMIGMAQTPDLMGLLSDPDVASRLLGG